MKQHLETLSVTTFGPGLYDFTDKANDAVEHASIGLGVATFFIRHTSASLLIQENADRDVLADLEAFMRRVVSRDPSLYRHTTEGPDDMPSHIRAALTATSLSVPISGGKIVLGTWQGLYVFERRDAGHRREVAVHVLGE